MSLIWKKKWQLKRRRFFLRTLFFKYKNISWPKLLRLFTLFIFAGILTLFLLTSLLFAYYAKELPRPDMIIRREGFSTKIFARKGELLYDVFSEQQRTPVELKDVPQHLREATIAIEDKNFYKHQGFDPKGWLRAIFNIVFRFRLQGGSTLTQQLVKNVLLTPKRTLSRKIKEFILAVQIEKKYTKDEILQMYLNEAPYGGTAWGVGTAAEIYFNKKVNELNLAESAILAGLPQSPSYYSPFGPNPNAYLKRTLDVLRRMREDGYITVEEEKKAQEELKKIKIKPSGAKFKAPHFVMYIKQFLEEQYGEKIVEQGGLRVYTTLDLELQEKAEEIVRKEIEKVEKHKVTNGAALVLDPNNGEILAMVGSKNFFAKDYDGQVNVCLSLRQPGSSIKPITYVTALKKGFTAATMIVDTETRFVGGPRGDYIPKNYDRKEYGPVQLRYALGNSLNISSVKLLALVGVKDMLETAYSMGLTTLEPTQENINRLGLSVTLGGGEVRLIDLAAAYSAFANGGFKIEPQPILKIEDHKGKIIYEAKKLKSKKVLDEGEAFIISHILQDNQARLLTFGANSLLNITSRQVAVKTGTTDDLRDNWAIGWTPDKLVAVWVGNNDNSPMDRVVSGITGASPIWRQIMLEAVKKDPLKEFKKPDKVIEKEVDIISGWPSHDNWPKRTEFFIKGTEPNGPDPIHTKLKVCKTDGNKLAPETLVAKGEFEEKEYIILKETDPIAKDKNRWQEGIDNWINKQSDNRYKYPKEFCSSPDEVIVKIKKPADWSEVDNEFELEVEAVADDGIEKVEFYIDDKLEAEIFTKPYKSKLILENGIYKLKAVAYSKSGKSSHKEITLGVNQNPKISPSPSLSPSILPSVLPSPSVQ